MHRTHPSGRLWGVWRKRMSRRDSPDSGLRQEASTGEGRMCKSSGVTEDVGAELSSRPSDPSQGSGNLRAEDGKVGGTLTPWCLRPGDWMRASRNSNLWCLGSGKGASGPRKENGEVGGKPRRCLVTEAKRSRCGNVCTIRCNML